MQQYKNVLKSPFEILQHSHEINKTISRTNQKEYTSDRNNTIFEISIWKIVKYNACHLVEIKQVRQAVFLGAASAAGAGCAGLATLLFLHLTRFSRVFTRRLTGCGTVGHRREHSTRAWNNHNGRHLFVMFIFLLS